MNSAVFLAANLHCPSCISHVCDILHTLAGVSPDPEVSLITQSIRVKFNSRETSYQPILDALLSAAFDIKYVTVYDASGNVIRDLDTTLVPDDSRRYLVAEQHIENCDACRNHVSQAGAEGKAVSMTLSQDSFDDLSENLDKPAIIDIGLISDEDLTGVYIATVSIEGMTCGNCVGTITRRLQELDFVTTATVDLLSNSGVVEFRGKFNQDKILEALDEIGYFGTLLDLSEQRTKNTAFIASVSIEGMTCGSCVGTITRKIQELDYVISVNVDLLNNSGVVEFHGKHHLDAILEAFDEIGYTARLVELSNKRDKSRQTQERQVEIQVEGIHCHRCPERITRALQESLSPGNSKQARFQIVKNPSLKEPRIRLSYKPDPSKGITVRHFISVVRAIDPKFKVSVYHPPTTEERSRQIQNREKWAILYRMIFTGIVAIPSFIIGVVYMALVPANNSTRRWFEEPIWAGSAPRTEWALLIMTTPVMFFGTDLFHRRAVKEIWSMWKPRSTTPLLRRFYRFGSMNMLISVGTIVAYVASLAVLAINASTEPMAGMEGHDGRMSVSYFDVIIFLTFFILVGKYLEAYSKAKTGDAVAMLAKLRPNEADLVDESGSQKVSVDQLEVDDVVRIPQGHSPPADGIIKEDGAFSFDESSLTGESKPVKKTIGDTVYTGTVNVGDPVQIQVTDVGGTSMLDQIIDVVRGGQAKRAPIERFADVLTGYFVPIVTLLAIVTWITWLSLGLSGRLPHAWLDTDQGGWTYWSLEFAIAVFVVACPCGIGLAAPTALFVGGGLAARRGILVQGGGQAFQEASSLNTIVFDKTGTLTQGKMQVTEYQELSQKYGRDLVMAMSGSMEALSSHPIAQAITAFCSTSTTQVTMSGLHELPGYGLTAKFSTGDKGTEQTFQAAIGNQKLLAVLNKELSAQASNGKEPNSITSDADAKNPYLDEFLFRHQSQAHSVAIIAVRLANRFEPVGVFGLSDPIRPEALGVIASLQRLNLSIHLCTGDNATTANAVASQLEIPPSHVRAGILPGGKADYIRELQHPVGGSRKLVAFVGDGLNDTPALSAADVSVSLSSGSDIAINASSFILLKSHLGSIYELLTLSKRVFRRVKINFLWAGVYNITLIPVAAGIFFSLGATDQHGGWRMSPVWAAVAMAGSSVSVVLSSLALKLPEFKWPLRRTRE